MNKLELRTQIENPWDSLRKYTQARIAIGRCGSSIPTQELLDFKMAHAKAIDAVHIPLNMAKLATEVKSLVSEQVLLLHSAAATRTDYLRRPDWGRKLSVQSAKTIAELTKKPQYDVALVIADGLSSHAVDKNIAPLFKMLIPELQKTGMSLAPITLVEQGRVAIADEIAAIFNAKISVIFIGERPGLKSPDSLGIYLTYNPSIGTTDERRNCISNVRTEGLVYEQASSKLLYLINESYTRKISGVDLKDEQEEMLPTANYAEVC